MKSSSSSSSLSSSTNPSPSAREITHDVFLSFRGDTRCGFTSHLFAALTRHEIRTYMDYNLERGDEISSTLLGAIERSKISLIVFSKNYATSRWTLDELVKIMECKRTKAQTVIPIFYDIDPSDVRHQRGSYATAFAQHKKWFRASINETVQRWTNAMTEAANLSGWDCSAYRMESELVEEIAIVVKKKLECMGHCSEPESPTDKPNPDDSEDFLAENEAVTVNLALEDSFARKCLSLGPLNLLKIIGYLSEKTRDACIRKEHEKLVLKMKGLQLSGSDTDSLRSHFYRNPYKLKQEQPWWRTQQPQLPDSSSIVEGTLSDCHSSAQVNSLSNAVFHSQQPTTIPIPP